MFVTRFTDGTTFTFMIYEKDMLHIPVTAASIHVE